MDMVVNELAATLTSTHSKGFTACEIGSFVGYDTIRFAKSLPADGHLLACESDRFRYALSNALINFAGVQDKITLYYGDAHTMLRKIHMQG